MYETRGSIHLITDTQSFPSGFTKREFVVTTTDRYPQHLKFEVVKERCALLDGFSVGDEVVVNFDIRGNEFNGKYFVNLSCWKLQQADGAEAAPDAAQRPRQSAGGPPAGGPPASRPAARQAEPSLAELRNEKDFDDEDEIPF